MGRQAGVNIRNLAFIRKYEAFRLLAACCALSPLVFTLQDPYPNSFLPFCFCLSFESSGCQIARLQRIEISLSAH
jgi:hypothetical protein